MILRKKSLYITIITITLLLVLCTKHSMCQPTKGGADAHFYEKNYSIALKQYSKLLRSEKNDPYLIKQLGMSHLYCYDDKSKAIPFLEQADTLPEADRLVHMELGKAYLHVHDFIKAEKYLKEYIADPGLDPPEENIESAKRNLEYIANAQNLMKQPLDVSFVNLGDNINSNRSEFYPLVTSDGEQMFLTNDRKYISDFELLIRNVYTSKPSGGGWAKIKSMGSKINTEEDETVVWVSDNGGTMLLYANTMDYEHDLLICKKKMGRFREKIPLGSNINSEFIEMGACLNKTEDTIYFASDRHDGIGGMDIYYAIKLPSGEFGLPKNMGKNINTPYDDNFPRLSPDGKKLYFASMGHNSMGGYDIFTSEWDAATNNWKQPVNFGYPVNNTYDNEIISLTADGRYGYISAYKKDSKGFRDIYQVIFNNIEADKIVFTGFIAVGDTLNTTPLNDVSNEISMKVFREGSEDIYGLYSANKKTGRYAIALPPGKYELKIEGEAYDPYSQIFEVYNKFYEVKVLTNNIWLKKKGT